jgi:type IV pilus biogenesis protein PilP
MSNNRARYILAAAISAAFLSTPSSANEAVIEEQALAIETGEIIRKKHERIALNKLEIEDLEVQLELEKKRRTLAELQNMQPPAAQGEQSTTAESASKPADAEENNDDLIEQQRRLPSVRSVEGVGNTLQAVLVMHDRSIQTVQKGDRLISGWKVVNIDVNKVTVAKGNETIKLAFGERVTYAPAEGAIGAGSTQPFLNPPLPNFESRTIAP